MNNPWTEIEYCNAGDISSKTSTWPISNTECLMGTNWKTRFLGSRPISRLKVKSKNYNQHFIKHDEDYKSIHNLKLVLNQNYNRNSFYIKSLDRLQDNVRFSIFRTYPEFESLSRFWDKTHFPVFEYNPQSKQNSLS